MIKVILPILVYLLIINTALAGPTKNINNCFIPAPTRPVIIGEKSFHPLAGPIIYDLDNDGITLRNRSDGVWFDMNNDGKLDQTGWTNGKDGLLVLDINCNGVIDNQSEIFGSVQSPSYRHLLHYDSNKDKIINIQDPIWPFLKIWVDKNINGKTEEGELKNISILQIKNLNVFYNTYQYINKNQPHEKREEINNFFYNIIKRITNFLKRD